MKAPTKNIKRKQTAHRSGREDKGSRKLKLLSPSADSLTGLIKSSACAIVIYNEKQILYCNEYGCRATGYTLDELTGMQLENIFVPEDRDYFKKRAKKRVAGSKISQRFELKVLTKTGNVLWVDFTANRTTFNGKPAILGIVFDITEKKLAIEKLNETNSLLIATLESTADGILVVDGLGKIRGYNNTFKKMWRIPLHIIKQNNDDVTINFVLDQLMYPEEFLNKVYFLYNHPEKSSFDTLKFKDGRIFERYSMPQMMNKRIVGRVWSFRDVTGRKKAESQRLLNEERLETLLELYNLTDSSFDNIADFVLEKAVKLTESKVGFIAFTNSHENMFKMHSWTDNALKQFKQGDLQFEFQVDKSGLLGETIKKKKPLIVNDYKKVPNTHQNYPANQIKIKRYVSVPIVDQGRTVILVTVANKESDYDKNDINQLKLLFNSMWNLIQRKKIIEDIIESEKRYRIITDSSNDLISKINTDLIFTYASPASITILGYKPQELIGKRVLNFIYQDDKKEFETFIRSLLKNVKAGLIKYRFLNKNGEYIWLESNNRVLVHTETETREVISVTRDLSEIIAAEKLLREKDEALLANKAKSEFLANISHEIRNPLNSIIGLTNNLTRKLKNTEHSEVVESIRISSGYLLNIINDVLDFSKIEAHKVEMLDNSFNPAALIRSVYIAFVELAAKKNIKLSIHKDFDKRIWLKGDDIKLNQILINLASNAIKFTEHGEVKITVRIAHQDDNKVMFTALVSDTGLGIRREDQGKIFQSFTQIDSSTTKSYPGTGLGLAIVKSYTEMMKGNVSFSSEESKGTIFRVDLPFELTNPEEKESVVVADEPQPEAMNALKILVAEDDAINQLYLKEFLVLAGHKVDTAFNGYEVLEKFTPGKYDLILMDGQMPRMDGFSATRIIREREAAHGVRTPIIAITGYAVSGDEKRFLEAGMDAYISKPIDESKLMELLRKFCSK